MGVGEVDDVTSDGRREQVDFGYRGVAYRATLTPDEAASLEGLMSKYAEVGRVGTDRSPGLRVVAK